jgi:ribosome biogenesis GTPase
MQGVVIKSTGSWYKVLVGNGNILEAKSGNNLRLSGSKTTNPIAVGDRVILKTDVAENIPTIVEIEQRTNYIIRRSVNLSRQEQILAANIDTVFVVATVAHPRTSPGFIDRVLCTAEAYRINGVIVFNKIDIYDEEEREYLNAFAKLYETIGYKVLLVSAVSEVGLEQLKAELKDKTSLFAGHSGVGKSSLLNALDANLSIKVGVISDVHQKGKHTTTFAEMHPLGFGGFIIDTPGIKEFGVIDIDKNEVGHYFPEMFDLLPQCKFNDCSHQNEPGCAVQESLKLGRIAESRYASYLGILNSEDLLDDWEKD